MNITALNSKCLASNALPKIKHQKIIEPKRLLTDQSTISIIHKIHCRMDLPLFPLKLVLFPQGLLPLKIFEKRYVDMVRNCLRNQQGFGIVSVCDDHDQTAPLPFSSVGVLVEIIETNIPQPGLFSLKCLGKQKFHIQSAVQQKDLLWMGKVEMLPIEVDTPLPDDLIASKTYFEQLIHSLEEEKIDANAMPFHSPYALNDCAWLANRWCEILDMPLIQKQRMLELDSPLIRLELINDMLTKNNASA